MYQGAKEREHVRECPLSEASNRVLATAHTLIREWKSFTRQMPGEWIIRMNCRTGLCYPHAHRVNDFAISVDAVGSDVGIYSVSANSTANEG
jgi:hypothetical protein